MLQVNHLESMPMPTAKPRMSITVEPEDMAILDRFALASGRPRASILAELVRATVPQLERAAKLMEMARQAPAEVIDGLVDDLEAATDHVVGSLDGASRAYEGLIAGLSPVPTTRKPSQKAGGVQVSPAERGAPGRRRTPPLDPHLLTGGSNS